MLPNWVKQQYSIMYCLELSHFKYKDTNWLKVKEWEKLYHDKTSQIKARVPMLVLEKRDFRAKNVTRINVIS